MREKNGKLLVLGTVTALALIIQFAVLITLTVVYGREAVKPKFYETEQVQQVLEAVDSAEVQGLFCSMFSVENYEVDDFFAYRGIKTVMLEQKLENGDELLTFLKMALNKEQQALENVYIGICPETIYAAYDSEEEITAWKEAFSTLMAENAQIKFHIVIDYPGEEALALLTEDEKEAFFKGCVELTTYFTQQPEGAGAVVFAPGMEKWLVANRANYEENGLANKAVNSFLIRAMFCDYLYTADAENIQDKVDGLRQFLSEPVEQGLTDPEYTYVFFGDSVIGNYTDSMSIPGVVEGFTGARVVNCGYGGLSASRNKEDGYCLADVIDAFLQGEYASFEEVKAVHDGIPAFYEALPEINQEKLIFFISIGLNDYMSGHDLTGTGAYDNYEKALTEEVHTLQKAYPKSEIVLLTPNFIGLYENGTQKINGYTLEEMVSIIKKLSGKLKVKCIDVYGESGINAENTTKYLADLCHPNELGRYEIGKLLYEKLADWEEGAEMVSSAAVLEDVVQEGYGVYADEKENLESNAFFDALVYTGYNIEKHRSDGLMWHYVLAAHKRGKGWLSDITYNGGSDGYEVTEDGLPDIGFFEKYGLVCASYATYVYFNYLPNVAGIDTSELTRPEKAYNANDWYLAAQDWVEKGYAKNIDFEAELRGGFIHFEEAEEIPIGSIIAFCDAKNKSDYCSHVVVYAGYENDYHWVFHVGNENGPEFCSVERMHFGPDPQWPIAVITTPKQVIGNITQ